MDVLSGEIKVVKGFLESAEKRIFEAQDKKVWVDEAYVKTLEEEMGKMLTIARDALKLSAISRERLRLLESKIKEAPQEDKKT
jgi:hypothetical protein